MNEHGSCEDESWECIWPPEVTEDMALVKIVVGILKDPSFHASHERAWAALNLPDLGIQPGLTLIEELQEKSGTMVQPFIDLAVDNLFSPLVLGSRSLGEEAETVLLGNHEADEFESSSLSEDDLLEASLRDKRCLDLYRGCVWELCAMFTAHLLAIARGVECDDRIQASTYEPADRAMFIRLHS